MAFELIGNGGEGGRREAEVEVEGWVKGAGGSLGLVYHRRIIPVFLPPFVLQLFITFIALHKQDKAF